MASTFDGLVVEFPGLQIDFFGCVDGHPPPKLVLLSHVHSDHLRGLDSPNYMGPTVYCSTVTRNLLFKIKDKKHQETEGPETYKFGHLHREKLGFEVVKPLALDTPHELELSLDLKIRITLIDAHHCPGSVMFLVEGSNSKAILYTGDLRAEPWFVNGLCHNYSLVKYTSGRTPLDCIYLDTSFACRKNRYSGTPENVEGIRSLIDQVEKYADKTVFMFMALTIGYEEAWLAIASHFKAKIHVDRYHYDLYQSIGTGDAGLWTQLQQCLTLNPFEARFHICTKSSNCPFRQRNDIVFVIMTAAMDERSFAAKNESIRMHKFTLQPLNFGARPAGDASAFPPNEYRELSDVYTNEVRRYVLGRNQDVLLPTHLAFRFSRHSSFPECRHLLSIFQPKSVYPCFQTPELYSSGFSMKQAFGAVCLTDQFRCDEDMKRQTDDKEPHRLFGTKPRAPQYPRQIGAALRAGLLSDQTNDSTSEDSFAIHATLQMLNTNARSATQSSKQSCAGSPSQSSSVSLDENNIEAIAASLQCDSSLWFKMNLDYTLNAPHQITLL